MMGKVAALLRPFWPFQTNFATPLRHDKGGWHQMDQPIGPYICRIRRPGSVGTRCRQSSGLEGKESGWEGPPFNPLKLAELLGVHIVANASIGDARVFVTDAGPRIEYNPQQPRERVQFSIAHELAHILFPDWREEVGIRGSAQSGDEWQLEMLCNLAASEFVLPIGSIASGIEIKSIEELMVQRREFDVSAEAFLNRVARVAQAPIGVFFASRTNEDADAPEYRLDYFISSPTAPQLNLSGLILPRDSKLRFCTAVGYTDRTEEDWATGDPVQIELVGIPPYPGRIYPRVAGLVRFSGAELKGRPIQYVHGSILEPRNSGLKVACQLVNDKAIKWGGGVARKFGRKYPEAEDDFSSEMIKLKIAERLGKVIFTRASDELVIASLIVQEGYGPSLFPRCDIPLSRKRCIKSPGLHVAKRPACICRVLAPVDQVANGVLLRK